MKPAPSSRKSVTNRHSATSQKNITLKTFVFCTVSQILIRSGTMRMAGQVESMRSMEKYLEDFTRKT